MKSFKSILLVGAASLSILLSSCLGNGNSSTSGPVLGVVGVSTTGRTLLQTDNMNYYFQGLENSSQFPVGSCWLANIRIDYDVQTSTEYTVATLESSPIQFDTNSNVMSLPAGDIVLEEKEKVIGDIAIYGIVKDHLFMESIHKNNTNQLNSLKLYLDPNQEPEKYTLEGSEYNMYTAYVRSICTTEGDQSSSKNESKATAFSLNYLGREIKEREKAKAKAACIIQVKYIKSIKEDGTFELSDNTTASKAIYVTGYTAETTNK